MRSKSERESDREGASAVPSPRSRFGGRMERINRFASGSAPRKRASRTTARTRSAGIRAPRRHSRHFRDAARDGERKSLTDDAVESTTRDDVCGSVARLCAARARFPCLPVCAARLGRRGNPCHLLRHSSPARPDEGRKMRRGREEASSPRASHPRRRRGEGTRPPEGSLARAHRTPIFRGPRSVSLVHEETSERSKRSGSSGPSSTSGCATDTRIRRTRRRPIGGAVDRDRRARDRRETGGTTIANPADGR